MAAVSQKIPNLLGGISQQPDPVKLPGQVRDAVNVYLDPTFGCRKRPATQFIASLATNIPASAKWFPIFRDHNERYAVAIYNTPTFTIKVWDMNDGLERTVTISDSAKAYFQGATPPDIEQLTIADYTLIVNRHRVISMNGDESTIPANKEALVIINSVAYNTTYSIDLARDGDVSETKVYKASKLEVLPGSYEENDGGICSDNSAEDHQVSDPANGKTGLQFRIVNQCAAYLVNNAYVSRYTTSIILKNGGTGWRKGDEVKVTQKGQEFTVRVAEEKFIYTSASDGIATYTTPSTANDGTLEVGDIISNLQTEVNAIPGYSSTYVGNVLKVTRTDGRQFNLSVRGGVTDKAMVAIKDTARDVADLPYQCFPDYVCKVVNTEKADSDDYYVKFVPDSPGIAGTGSWIETVAPGVQTNLNPSTLPHALIRQANGSFTLGPLDSESAFGGWAGREVGDKETNPDPSFVGQTIYSMFFHANRLGFLSEDSVILSQPGDYFNFFTSSALTVSDSDPIDITASSTKPAILKGVIGVPKGLVLFAERSQFLLSAQEVTFSANTVKLTEISNYFYRSDIEPLSTGVSISFISQASTYSKVMEMAVDSIENRPAVADITRVIPEYLPSNLKWGEVLPNKSMLIYGDNSANAYVFTFFNNGNERQLAGWTKWVFPYDIVMWGSEDDLSHIISFDGKRHNLLRMELTDDPDNAPLELDFSSFTPRLDNYVTSWDLPAPQASLHKSYSKIYIPEHMQLDNATYVIVSTEGEFKGSFTRPLVEKEASGQWYVSVDSRIAKYEFVLGIEYSASVELPSFFVTQQTRADRVNIPIVEFLYLDLYYSGSYRVHIEKPGYNAITTVLEVTPANAYDANDPPIEEISTLTVPICSRGDIVKTTITALDPFPCSITGYSWSGHYNNRGISPLQP